MISFATSFRNLRPHESPSFLESIKASFGHFKTQGMTDILAKQLPENEEEILRSLYCWIFFSQVYRKTVVSYPLFSTVIFAWIWPWIQPFGQPCCSFRWCKFPRCFNWYVASSWPRVALGHANLTLIPWYRNGWGNSKKTVRNRMWISLHRQK